MCKRLMNKQLSYALCVLFKEGLLAPYIQPMCEEPEFAMPTRFFFFDKPYRTVQTGASVWSKHAPQTTRSSSRPCCSTSHSGPQPPALAALAKLPCRVNRSFLHTEQVSASCLTSAFILSNHRLKTSVSALTWVIPASPLFLRTPFTSILFLSYSQELTIPTVRFSPSISSAIALICNYSSSPGVAEG